MEGNSWFESLTIYDVSHPVNSADSCPPGPVVPHTSCRSRCYEPYDGDVPGCRCDANCEETNSCCFDFNDTCTLPSKRSRVWMFHCDSQSSLWAEHGCCAQVSSGSAPGFAVERRDSRRVTVTAPTTVCLQETAAQTTNMSATVSVSTGHKDQIQTGCKYLHTLCVTCRLFR